MSKEKVIVEVRNKIRNHEESSQLMKKTKRADYGIVGKLLLTFLGNSRRKKRLRLWKKEIIKHGNRLGCKR